MLLEFCWQQHFSFYQEIQIADTDCIFNFFGVLKDYFNKYDYNLDDVNKTAIPGVLKTEIFWNNGYEIIISVYDVTKKFFHVAQNIL